MLWKLLGTGGAVAAGAATRKIATSLWEVATGNTPPENPEHPETTWAEALAWAALSGALIGIARMAATRQAAVLYSNITGDLPKSLS